jgi:exodeoxyribonuclease VII large subunit
VGHETDSSVVDFVADRRAPTPSVAAELAVPDLAGIRADLGAHSVRLWRGGEARVAQERRALAASRARLARLAPAVRLATGRIDLDRRQQRLALAIRRTTGAEVLGLRSRLGLLRARGPAPRLRQSREEFSGRVGRLEALSPLAVLGRGYSITLTEAGPEVLRDAERVTVGATVATRLHRGRLRSRVIEVQLEPEGGTDGA